MRARRRQRDPIAEELVGARRTTYRFWALQWFRIPDFGEAAGGWAALPRSGKWIIAGLIIGSIMAVPVIGIVAGLLN